jgi:copper oxidase (laccase) domain-containing protein
MRQHIQSDYARTRQADGGATTVDDLMRCMMVAKCVSLLLLCREQ